MGGVGLKSFECGSGISMTFVFKTDWFIAQQLACEEVEEIDDAVLSFTHLRWEVESKVPHILEVGRSSALRNL